MPMANALLMDVEAHPGQYGTPAITRAETIRARNLTAQQSKARTPKASKATYRNLRSKKCKSIRATTVVYRVLVLRPNLFSLYYLRVGSDFSSFDVASLRPLTLRSLGAMEVSQLKTELCSRTGCSVTAGWIITCGKVG